MCSPRPRRLLMGALRCLGAAAIGSRGVLVSSSGFLVSVDTLIAGVCVCVCCGSDSMVCRNRMAWTPSFPPLLKGGRLLPSRCHMRRPPWGMREGLGPPRQNAGRGSKTETRHRTKSEEVWVTLSFDQRQNNDPYPMIQGSVFDVLCFVFEPEKTLFLMDTLNGPWSWRHRARFGPKSPRNCGHL